MPLQYMCHMNYAYVPNATFRQNIPDTALKLRESVPAHVKPTAQWLAFNQRLLQGEASLATLNEPDFTTRKSCSSPMNWTSTRIPRNSV